MSIHCVFQETALDPAEYQSDNSDVCIVCGRDHDLDDGEDFRRVEGLPGGESIICSDCALYCQDCGELVLESNQFNRTMTVSENVTWMGGKPFCFVCVGKGSHES